MNIVYIRELWEKKIILRVKFYTSKINVFPVSYAVFFLPGGQKLDFLTSGW